MAAKQVTLGALIDALKKARDNRIERQKEIDALKETERDLKNKIITLMEKSGQTSSTGKIATATIKVDLLPRVTDWPSVYNYIKKNDAFDLLERRIGKLAFKARLEAKEHVPGIDVFEDKDLSLTKA